MAAMWAKQPVCGTPTIYDAQKYFDDAKKQKAKGNRVEALNYYAKVLTHRDLGVKPCKPHIELCMGYGEWENIDNAKDIQSPFVLRGTSFL